MKFLRGFIKHVDRFSEWSGKAVAWTILFLVGELVYDSVARYAFNAPTVWSFDISYMIYSLLFMLGGAYTLLIDEHIRIDLIYKKVSLRTRAAIEIIGYLVLFFPVMAALVYFGIGFTIDSWRILEHQTLSYWGPPIYPFKALIPVAAILLLLQGIAQFIRSLLFIVKGEEL